MSAHPEPQTVTVLLQDDLGAQDRMNRLLPLVYNQLRAVANHALASENSGHTLQATALVHEAYLKLVGDRQIPWANRAHFYVAAAEAMRRILMDHARAAGRVKRGGGRSKLALSDVADLAREDPGEILRFDDAFQRLEAESPDAAAVVRLRFYAGLSVEQAADALGMSMSTVDRRWSFARAWLFRNLSAAG